MIFQWFAGWVVASNRILPRLSDVHFDVLRVCVLVVVRRLAFLPLPRAPFGAPDYVEHGIVELPVSACPAICLIIYRSCANIMFPSDHPQSTQPWARAVWLIIRQAPLHLQKFAALRYVNTPTPALTAFALSMPAPPPGRLGCVQPPPQPVEQQNTPRWRRCLAAGACSRS